MNFGSEIGWVRRNGQVKEKCWMKTKKKETAGGGRRKKREIKKIKMGRKK